jgi:ubiquitin carboxyl-terminal hydrolase 22/27/51
LSTVICHKGDITGGHYVAYVRNMGNWFRCDDAWVSLVAEEEVVQSQAYMLFFVQGSFS